MSIVLKSSKKRCYDKILENEYQNVFSDESYVESVKNLSFDENLDLCKLLTAYGYYDLLAYSAKNDMITKSSFFGGGALTYLGPLGINYLRELAGNEVVFSQDVMDPALNIAKIICTLCSVPLAYDLGSHLSNTFKGKCVEAKIEHYDIISILKNQRADIIGKIIASEPSLSSISNVELRSKFFKNISNDDVNLVDAILQSPDAMKIFGTSNLQDEFERKINEKDKLENFERNQKMITPEALSFENNEYIL